MNDQQLENRQARGIRWNTIMSVLTFATQFVALYFLNKIISPDDFGKAIWAMSALTVGLALSNLSFAVVAIRQKTLNEKEMNAIFFFTLAINTTIFLFYFFVLPKLNFKPIQFSKSFLQAFSFLFLLKNLELVNHIKYQREMQFDRLSSISLFSRALSLTLAIVFAIKANLFWSLFFLYGGSLMTKFFLIGISQPWRVSRIADFNFIKQNLSFGASFTLHKLVNAITGNIAPLLIGNYYDKQAVSEYHKSFGYRSLPIVHIAAPIAQVMFPTFSKLQEQPRKLSAFFLKAQNLTSFVLLPIFFLLFALAKPFTVLYFDEDWNIERITILLRIFSIAGALSIFNPNFYSFFSVVSKAKEMNTIVLSQRIITILAILISLRFGIIAVAISVLCSECIALGINAAYGKKYFYQDQLVNMVSIFLKVIIIATVSALIGFSFFHYLTQIISPVMHFILAGITSALFYLMVSYIVNRKGFDIFKDIFLNR